MFLVLAVPPSADANGDPASHVLLPLDSYVPLAAGRSSSAANLTRGTDQVYRRGYRIKVAVIAGPEDLGTVPQLFNKPQTYARLLGKEIASFYVGPLLVVMPKGLSIYDGGRSVARERRALHGLRVKGRSAVELTAVATAAVSRLKKGTTLSSKDIVAPNPIPMFTLVHPGQPATLNYRILEDSKWASSTVTVFAGDRLLAAFHKPLHQLVFADIQSVKWTPPEPLPAQPLRFCVSARDRAGNHHESCLPLRAEAGG